MGQQGPLPGPVTRVKIMSERNSAKRVDKPLMAVIFVWCAAMLINLYLIHVLTRVPDVEIVNRPESVELDKGVSSDIGGE